MLDWRKFAAWVFVLMVIVVGKVQLVHGEEFEEQLYARGAVLMDGDSGRVLYGKDADAKMPMASTTKVMTCILALEKGNIEEAVEVSRRAASQPDVQLNMTEGERYRLKDLLYSLMLKSHNDSAVAIAEHIGGSVEGFAEMMNQKAAELGCRNTHFVTPNGLDGQDEGGIHATTARDLAAIMRYAIKNPKFLEITQTPDYSFTDLDKKRTFVIHGTNALLGTMDGMLAGKTGFTGDAGYCYVCAVKRDDRTFIVALLACGWPNNKNYKWSDTNKLIDYAFRNYQYRDIWQDKSFGAMEVEEGIPLNGHLFDAAYTNVEVLGAREQRKRYLLRKDEKIVVQEKLAENLKAPVRKGEVVGSIVYLLDGEILCEYPVILKNDIYRRNFVWCFKKLIDTYVF